MASTTPAAARPSRNNTPRQRSGRSRTVDVADTQAAPVVPAPTRGRGVTRARTRTAPVAPAPAAAVPAGFGAAPLAADVSGQLKAVAPTFGQVLESVGAGVADSQAALDQGVIDTVNTLGNTNITVVTDVIQHLNDDGEPDPSLTELITTDLSVLNFFTPTIHEWKRVALSMDLSVGAFSETDGFTLNAEQSGGGVGGVGLFWGFLGLAYDNNYDDTQVFQRTHEQESSWSAGEVRLDAVLGPRTTGKFPIPDQVSVGPQISFAQGTTVETPVAGAGVNRSVDLVISVTKASGDANPGKAVTVDAGSLRTSFSSTAPFTNNQTNADGQIKVTITRNVPNAGTGAAKVTITARLGALSQTYPLTI
jgi:hypothetical protein